MESGTDNSTNKSQRNALALGFSRSLCYHRKNESGVGPFLPSLLILLSWAERHFKPFIYDRNFSMGPRHSSLVLILGLCIQLA